MNNEKNDTRIRSMRRAVIMLALLIVASSAHAQSATLRYRWTKGETLTYRMVMQTSSSVTGMPGIAEMKIDQTMTQVIKMTTVEVAEDGTATLRETFESLKMEMDGPMGHVAYDTAAPSSLANPMIQALKQSLEAIAGASVTIVQAPDGTIRKIEGASKIIDQMTRSMQNDPAAAQSVQGLKAAFSDEALTTTLGQSFPKLPPTPVKTADTWPAQTAMGNEMIGRVVGDVKFTVKSIEEPLARIDVALVLKQEIAPPPGPNGMTIRVGDARGTGDLVFDLAKGRIQESSMKTDMPSKITMQAPDGSMANIDNKTTTTVKMVLVEK